MEKITLSVLAQYSQEYHVPSVMPASKKPSPKDENIILLKNTPSRKGMFVSIFHKKDNRLIGCMGSLVPVKDNLFEETEHWANMAFLQDTRGGNKTFRTISEITVILSFIERLESVDSYLEINSIKEGMLIRIYGGEALVLPGEAYTAHYALRIILQKLNLQELPEKAEIYRVYADRFGDRAGTTRSQ